MKKLLPFFALLVMLLIPVQQANALPIAICWLVDAIGIGDNIADCGGGPSATPTPEPTATPTPTPTPRPNCGGSTYGDCPEGQFCQLESITNVNPTYACESTAPTPGPGCTEVFCPAGQICDPQTGGCVSDPCSRCTAGQRCVGGVCINQDSCAGVSCGTCQACSNGACVAVPGCNQGCPGAPGCPPQQCANSCPRGQSQNPFPDCNCVSNQDDCLENCLANGGSQLECQRQCGINENRDGPSFNSGGSSRGTGSSSLAPNQQGSQPALSSTSSGRVGQGISQGAQATRETSQGQESGQGFAVVTTSSSAQRPAARPTIKPIANIVTNAAEWIFGKSFVEEAPQASTPAATQQQKGFTRIAPASQGKAPEQKQQAAQPPQERKEGALEHFFKS